MTDQAVIDKLVRYVAFKDNNEAHLIGLLNPWLLLVVADMSLWCEVHKMPFVITRGVDAEIPTVSTSDTHSTGRAVDVSVRGWTTDLIDEFSMDFNKKYEWIGAISEKTGKPLLVYPHKAKTKDNKEGELHFHIQVRRDASMFAPIISSRKK